MLLSTIDLKKLNTLTKYPSIATYHAMADGGRLVDDAPMTFSGAVHLSEKVDGTNSRIIIAPDGDFMIGSREELLHARGDRIFNPAMGIVEAVRPVAERAATHASGALCVFFMEAYGGSIGSNAKQYTGAKAVSVRLFDVVVFEADVLATLLDSSSEKLAAWRENGGQPFAPSTTTEAWADTLGIAATPRLGTLDASELPVSIADTAAWLAAKLERTRCSLDDGAGGAPEGLIVRSQSRDRIAKLRFEDYRRTLKSARR